MSLHITLDILEPHFSAIGGHLSSCSLEETISALAGSNARRVHFLGLELKKKTPLEVAWSVPPEAARFVQRSA